MIKVLQIGLGPLGQKVGKFIAERKGISTIAAVDTNPDLQGKDFGSLCGLPTDGVLIKASVEEAIADTAPDVAVLTTVSDLARISSQIEGIAKHGIPVVSTCEELSYPWDCDPQLAEQLDTLAKKHGVAVIGTGVNPGYLMDALPVFLTAVNQEVTHIKVNRFQDAQFRRIPFQRKIGAGLNLDAFEAKKKEGTLRHVGLTESIHMIANRMNWKLNKTEDIIQPVVAEETIETPAMTIEKGQAMGVRQVGRGYQDGEVKIELIFQAAVGEAESYDEILIEGSPNIHSKISGGVNGDIATSAITINTIPRVLESSPGLKTMTDISPVSFFG